MVIVNPILRGFHPDASVCVVVEDYYIAVSTFEWWPGVMIYHSKDLVHWRLAGRPLNRKSQLCLRGDRNSGGIWAPHLSWAKGRFWLMITDMKTDQCFKDTLNYVMSCETIGGEWSDPVFVHGLGFDPALFHDDDGKSYVMSMLWDYRPYKPNFNGVAIQEYSLEEMRLLGEPVRIFGGSGWGLTEGPQMIKKDGWYITFICARPLTLQRGRCVLGRETGIGEIEWINGWPRLKNPQKASCLVPESGEVKLPDRKVLMPKPPMETGWNVFTVPPLKVVLSEATKEGGTERDLSTETDFDGPDLPDYFQTLREPLGKHMSLCERPGYLRLYGQQSIASLHSQSMVARRWQNVCFRAGTVMEFKPRSYNQMAGLTCFYNTENYMYAYVSYDEDRKCKILDILVCGHGKTSAELGKERISIPDQISAVCLEVQVNREKLQFYYRWKKEPWKSLGGELPADHLSDDYIRDSALVFTGAMVGICVQDLYDHSAFADFDSFYYREQEMVR